MTINDLRDIFTIFHDGSLSAGSFNNNTLILTIKCEYLAEKIDSSFDTFYLRIEAVQELSLTPWFNNPDATGKYTDPKKIFESDLEILSAVVENATVTIYCKQHSPQFDYSGGTLNIRGQLVAIQDHIKRPFSIEQLKEISTSYWDNFNTRNR